MNIYYILLVLLPLLGLIIQKFYKSQKQTALYLILTGTVLTLVSSLRYGIGSDYFPYRSIYEQTSQLDLYQLFFSCPTEPLYALLQKIVFLLGGNYMIFLTVISIFIHSITMWFIYRFSKLPWLSVYLYISLQFFAHSMNLLRQSISVCFFLLAYPYLKKRKFIPYCCILIIGGFFHKSAFLMIPFYFILCIKNSKHLVVITSLIFTLFYCFSDKVMIFLTTYILPQYNKYLNSIFWKGNSFSYAIFPILYLLFVLFTKNKILFKQKQLIYFHSAFFSCLNALLVTKHFILERTSIYFFILSLIIIPELVTAPKRKKESCKQDSLHLPNIKKIGKQYGWLLCVLFFSFLYFLFAASKGYHNVYPYYSLYDRAGN